MKPLILISTGFPIENLRPETVKIYTAPLDPNKLPFDPKEVREYDLPWTPSDM